MISGGEEKKTLRLVARYGDACNVFAGARTGPDTVAAKLDILQEICVREGTDYGRIRKSILYVGPAQPNADGGSAFVDEMARYAEVGIEEVHLMPGGPDPVGYVRGLGEHIVPGLTSVALAR
jgi:hypothetical protein